MKKLYLIRHAKSDRENPALEDVERHLNERGYADANFMSKKFTGKADLIISSQAIRALTTALIFARNLNYNANKVSIKEELYDCCVKDYFSVIHSIDNSFESVLLFTHNPSITEFAESLVKSLPMEMPTCGIVGISFDTDDWKNVKTGELFMFDYPKK